MASKVGYRCQAAKLLASCSLVTSRIAKNASGCFSLRPAGVGEGQQSDIPCAILCQKWRSIHVRGPMYRTQLHFFLVLNPVAFSNHLASASHAWKTLLWNIQTNMAWSENFLFDQHGMVKETACNVGDCPAASQTAWDVPGTAHMITKDLLKFLKLFHSTRQIPFGREWFGPTEEALSPNITNQKFFRPKCRTDRIGLNCTFSLCWTRWLSVTIWRQPVMHEKLCYGTFRPTWHGLKTFCLTNMAWSKKQLATLETAQLHLKRHEMFQGQLIWSQKIFWNFWNYSTDPSTVVRPLKGTEQRKHSV